MLDDRCARLGKLNFVIQHSYDVPCANETLRHRRTATSAFSRLVMNVALAKSIPEM